jgi:hypothetical protein
MIRQVVGVRATEGTSSRPSPQPHREPPALRREVTPHHDPERMPRASPMSLLEASAPADRRREDRFIGLDPSDDHREKAPERPTERSGYRDRAWERRAGAVAFQSCGREAAPRASWSRAGWPKALTAVAQEAYVRGLSTLGHDLMQAT